MDYAHRNHIENTTVRVYRPLGTYDDKEFEHQETENENYFEELNDYLNGTMNV